MHPRRLTAFVLGLWLTGGVLMTLIASADNWQADHLVDHPSANLAVEAHLVGAATARTLFHYQAAEQTRRNFELWEMAQIALGSLFFLFLLFGTNESKAAILAGLLLLVLVLVQRFFLSPNIAALGRELDFVPPGGPSPGRGKLAVLLGFYGGVEVAKWLTLLSMAGRLILSRRGMESESVRDYVNPIDKTNYRHIDR
jgi:hypothetical protein